MYHQLSSLVPIAMAMAMKVSLARIMSQSCQTQSQISQGKRDLFCLTVLFSDLYTRKPISKVLSLLISKRASACHALPHTYTTDHIARSAFCTLQNTPATLVVVLLSFTSISNVVAVLMHDKFGNSKKGI